MTLECRWCRQRVAKDPHLTMGCGTCGVARWKPCVLPVGGPTHDIREQMALHYDMVKPCPARRGKEPCQFRLVDPAAAPPAAPAQGALL